MGDEVWIESDTTLYAGLCIHTIDSPTEGTHTYTVWGKSTSGTGDLFSISITGFIIGVK